MTAAPARALEVLSGRLGPAQKASTDGVHFSGEPFGGRDIQFQDPQIRIEFPAPLEEALEFLFVLNRLAADACQA